MKGFVVLSIAVLLMVSCASDQTQEISRLKQETADLRALAGPPPSSLDNLYPPGAGAPLYQIEMFGLDGPLTGIVIETERGNFELAKTHFEKFQTQYLKVSTMVLRHMPGPYGRIEKQPGKGSSRPSTGV